jgi:hypothetical protein
MKRLEDQFAVLVGQPLLAVRFNLADTVEDSQEWLSYKTN